MLEIVNWSASVQFSHSVMSNSLWPHVLHHARVHCPLPTSRVCSNSCPSSWWCHPTISSSVIPFSSCLQSFPVSGSLPMSPFFASGGPKYWSISFSISPSNEYSELISFRIDQFDLLAGQVTLKSSPTPRFKSINSSVISFSAQLSHPYMTTGKTIALTIWTSVGKVMSLVLICCLGWS